MACIPDDQIERLKQDISLVRLAERVKSGGVKRDIYGRLPSVKGVNRLPYTTKSRFADIYPDS